MRPERTRIRMVVAGHGDNRLGVNDLVDESSYRDGQAVVVLDAGSFKALLAVAKLLERVQQYDGKTWTGCYLCGGAREAGDQERPGDDVHSAECLFARLDADDLGWRDWPTS